jgi:hypothetical protein
MGKINFVRRFFYDFVEIVKPILKMIKKDINFKCTKERKESQAISEYPTLRSPNFDKEFILYIFSSDHSIATMLT